SQLALLRLRLGESCRLARAQPRHSLGLGAHYLEVRLLPRALRSQLGGLASRLAVAAAGVDSQLFELHLGGLARLRYPVELDLRRVGAQARRFSLFRRRRCASVGLLLRTLGALAPRIGLERLRLGLLAF